MKIKHPIQIVILVGLLLLFLGSTDPSNIPLPLILVPYLVGALIFYKLAYLVLHVLFRGTISMPKLKLYALILTVLTTNFALLKSIGQLTFQDGIISGAIIIVSVVYIGKFSLDTKS